MSSYRTFQFKPAVTANELRVWFAHAGVSVDERPTFFQDELGDITFTGRQVADQSAARATLDQVKAIIALHGATLRQTHGDFQVYP